LIRQGISVEIIAQATGLSIAQIEALRSSLPSEIESSDVESSESRSNGQQ
jgi:hypothetical protein